MVVAFVVLCVMYTYLYLTDLSLIQFHLVPSHAHITVL